tara:strand:- start:360 stop:860 length:501 start_codon:yes stop_codon:yes gene_type:complete
MKTSNKKALNLAETKAEEKLQDSGVDSIGAIAALKAGTHFKASDVAMGMSVEKGLEHGRLNNSSKAMEAATKRFYSATNSILEANDKILAETIRTENIGKKACSSVKSTVNQIKDQLLKVDSILGDNVEHKIQQLERVATALKVISDLSGDDKTMKIVAAMIKKDS